MPRSGCLALHGVNPNKKKIQAEITNWGGGSCKFISQSQLIGGVGSGRNRWGS